MYNLRNIFGVTCTPSGDRVLSKSKVSLQLALDHIEQGDSDIDIQHDLKIGNADVVNARTWYARFGNDANAPAPLPTGPKMFLLEECMPSSLLAPIKSIFGFSSHVTAEGWSRLQPNHTVEAMHRKDVDTGIADFALKMAFAGILTRDSDFIALSKRKDHPASQIHIFVFHGPWRPEDMRETLENSRSEMMATLKGTPDTHKLFLI